ncbi:MAG: hypothetical protein U5R30_08295 [Deltaproteobacteria bacterium]|nr:hypothetical protein [Deltaproteobacteria bacterium]
MKMLAGGVPGRIPDSRPMQSFLAEMADGIEEKFNLIQRCGLYFMGTAQADIRLPVRHWRHRGILLSNCLNPAMPMEPTVKFC